WIVASGSNGEAPAASSAPFSAETNQPVPAGQCANSSSAWPVSTEMPTRRLRSAPSAYRPAITSVCGPTVAPAGRSYRAENAPVASVTVEPSHSGSEKNQTSTGDDGRRPLPDTDTDPPSVTRGRPPSATGRLVPSPASMPTRRVASPTVNARAPSS